VKAPEHHRRRNGEVALGRAVFARRRAFGIFNLLDDTLARLDVGPARIRQGHLPGRPADKPGFQMSLELRNPAADGRERHAEPARCRRQAAGFDNRDKHQHCVEAVDQGLLSRISRRSFPIVWDTQSRRKHPLSRAVREHESSKLVRAVTADDRAQLK
jgi:hypothetical protein